MRVRILARVVSVVLTAGLAATGLAVAPVLVASASDTCTDWVFLGARGSGEPARDYASPTFGMGSPLSATYAAFAEVVRDAGQSIRAEGVVYSAVGVDGWDGATENALPALAGEDGPYSASVNAGSEAALLQLQTVVNECPTTQVVVGGYSQGAQAMDGLVESLNPTEAAAISGGVMYGDPKFLGDDAIANRSTFDQDHDGIFLPHWEWASKLEVPMLSYCNKADPICNITAQVNGVYYRDIGFILQHSRDRGTSIFEPHTEYVKSARKYATQLADKLGLPVDTKDLGNHVLYRYFINLGDYLGREVAAINAVHEAARRVVNDNPNAIFAFHPLLTTTGYKNQYKDETWPIQSFQANEFHGGPAADDWGTFADFERSLDSYIQFMAPYKKAAPTASSFTDTLADLAAERGLYRPLEERRPTAPQANLVIMAKSNISMYWADAITKSALMLCSTISVVDLDASGAASRVSSTDNTVSTTDSYDMITAATGGTRGYGAESATTVSVAALHSPELRISSPTTAFADETTTIVAKQIDDGWSDPVASVEWDFGDGMSQAVQGSSGVTHTWTTPGNYTVTATSRSIAGSGRPQSFTIKITEKPTSPPSAPAVTATSESHTVTLYWEPVDGATVYQILDVAGNPVVAFAPDPNDRGTQRWVTGRLPVDTTRTYSVQAISRVGISSASAPVTATTAYRFGLTSGSSVTDAAGTGFYNAAGAWVNGDYTCSTDGYYTGSIRATGNVTISTGCYLAGDVLAGGTVTLLEGAAVGGDIVARGNVELGAGAKVGGNVRTGGTATQNGLPIDSAVSGGVVEHDPDVPTPTVPQIDSPSIPDGTLLTDWSTFREDAVLPTAEGLSTPAQASENCTISSASIQTTGNLSIDATSPSSGCDTITLSGVDFKLAGDLTLFVSSVNLADAPVTVSSTDAAAHTLSIVSTNGGTLDLASSLYPLDTVTSIVLATSGAIKIDSIDSYVLLRSLTASTITMLTPINVLAAD